MKHKRIRLYPSEWYLDVLITNSEENAIKYQNKVYGIPIHELEEEPQHVNTVTTITSSLDSERKGETQILMILKNLDPKIVVHEITHVLWHFSKCTNVKLNYESQEFQALFNEYLYEEILNKNNYKKTTVGKPNKKK